MCVQSAMCCMGFKNMSQICDSPWKDCKRIQRFVMAKFQAIFQAILHLSALPLIIHACSMFGSSEFNESMQAATADGLNSAKPVQGTNFDSSFDDSFVSLSDRAEVADSPVVQVQSSPQNLEESQDLVNHSPEFRASPKCNQKQLTVLHSVLNS